MKEIHKNPNFYYVLIPALIALWPLLLKTVYMPNAVMMVENGKKDFELAQPIIKEILELDPDRLKFIDPNNVEAEFDYAKVIDKVADECRILSSDYKVSAKLPTKQGGKKTQAAALNLMQIDIETFSNFLSTILDNWSDLECEDVKITHKEGYKDKWDVQARLKYTTSSR